MVHWFWIKLGEILLGGGLALADYLSLHVLLCLIPAFFIAGAMIIFIPKDAIVRYMGKDSKRIIAYPVAAISGLLLAVCSCTVLPLFAGIKKKGAGLGPAMTFLFSAPAVNILALTYTGALIGIDIAIARAILALSFSIIIGLIMEVIFREKKNKKKNQITEENEEKEETNENNLRKEVKFDKKNIPKIFLTIAVIVTGVLIAFFNKSNLGEIGVNNPPLIQTIIWSVGLIILIGCFIFIKSKVVNLFLGLLYILFTGTSQISYLTGSGSSSMEINRTLEYFQSTDFPIDLANMAIKAILSIVVAVAVIIYAVRKFEKEEIKNWMRETWTFVKMIFPYLVIGVFLAGALGELIPAEFIQGLVGENTVIANLIGVLFGVIAYFPTLMEVPIARLFLDLGMSRGVLLAYLLADPELSIQSILVTRKFIGDKKNFVYIILVIIFTVIAGLLFGLLVSKEPIQFI